LIGSILTKFYLKYSEYVVVYILKLFGYVKEDDVYVLHIVKKTSSFRHMYQWSLFLGQEFKSIKDFM